MLAFQCIPHIPLTQAGKASLKPPQEDTKWCLSKSKDVKNLQRVLLWRHRATQPHDLSCFWNSTCEIQNTCTKEISLNVCTWDLPALLSLGQRPAEWAKRAVPRLLPPVCCWNVKMDQRRAYCFLVRCLVWEGLGWFSLSNDVLTPLKWLHIRQSRKRNQRKQRQVRKLHSSRGCWPVSVLNIFGVAYKYILVMVRFISCN